VAGNSAAQNIEGFVYVAMNAFSQAVVAFVSQNLGAGKMERINKVVITAQFCVLAVGLVLGNTVYLSKGANTIGVTGDVKVLDFAYDADRFLLNFDEKTDWYVKEENMMKTENGLYISFVTYKKN